MSEEACVFGCVRGSPVYRLRRITYGLTYWGAKHVESTLGQDIESIGDCPISDRNLDVSCMLMERGDALGE